mgnify:CR=1 FL=1
MALNVKELPILQTEIRKAPGNPEGNVYAPCGYLIVVENMSGGLYQKTTSETLKTGWVQLSVVS